MDPTVRSQASLDGRARTMERPVLVVLSERDPVAAALSELWGVPAATGDHVGGTAIRRTPEGLLTLRRPGPHIHDELLDARLPPGLRAQEPTLLFPSVHRSRTGARCLTVHPLGNPGATAELGGRPRTLVPTDPRRAAAILRVLQEEGTRLRLPATFEATHHGPELGVAAAFVEVAVPEGGAPTGPEVEALGRALRTAVPDPADRVALAAGGGHYAPRFTDLCRSRRWAFGHILSRHALEELDRVTAQAAFEATPGAEGVVFATARDRTHPSIVGIAPELRDGEAARRGAEQRPGPSGPSPPTSGT